MKLTRYIIELGRAVAYYPGLKQITGSTTSTILLCQFLYWCDKTRDTDGWIWKTSDEIEEETGLTANEQRTAKINLADLNLLQFEFKRLDHNTRYRVNQEELNRKWEEVTGKKSELVKKPVVVPEVKPEPVADDAALNQWIEEQKQLVEAEKNISASPVAIAEPHHTDANKKGDLIDAQFAFANSPGMVQIRVCNEIREKMEKKFHINMENKKWEAFINFVYSRQQHHNEPVEKFIEYALKEGFDPMFWTPEKCKTVWPRAFTNDANKPIENFVQPLPEQKEEVYIPMPKDIGRQKKLY
jgi:hypothetical protein